MRLHLRLKKLESQAKAAESFCPACMMITWTEYDGSRGDIDPAPTCPQCRRGPGDYPADMVRQFRLFRPSSTTRLA